MLTDEQSPAELYPFAAIRTSLRQRADWGGLDVPLSLQLNFGLCCVNQLGKVRVSFPSDNVTPA